MVLVDTSVWIRFLAGREPHASGLDRLLADDDVLSHDLVHGELLLGGGGRARAELLTAYGAIRRARTLAHAEVVALVDMRGLQGRGVGWIDVHMLGSTLVERCAPWTADARLAALAVSVGVAYAAA